MGPLTLYPRRFQAEVNGKPIRLTPTEFNLIRTLAEAPGQVFSRPQLIEKAFGYDFEGFERNVDVHVTSLRRKLEARAAPVSSRLCTVWATNSRSRRRLAPERAGDIHGWPPLVPTLDRNMSGPGGHAGRRDPAREQSAHGQFPGLR